MSTLQLNNKLMLLLFSAEKYPVHSSRGMRALLRALHEGKELNQFALPFLAP